MNRLTTAIAAAILVASCGSKAVSEIETEGIKTINAEGAKITWIRDNAEPRTNPLRLFPTASAELIESLGVQDGVASSMSAFLIREDGHNILFDAGLGGPDSQLLPALDTLGIRPEDIDYIFITHLHGDHIGGLMKNGEAVFTSAKVYLGRIEHDAWLEMDPSRNAQQLALYAAYEGQMNLFEFGDSLPFSIQALDARGHTPGHTAFQKGKVLIAGDLMHGTAIQMADPTVNSTYDMDQEMSIESRVRIMNYAKENNLLVAGMHFADPGFIDLR